MYIVYIINRFYIYNSAPSAVSPAHSHSGGSPSYGSSPGYSTTLHLNTQYPTNTISIQSDAYQINSSNSSPQYYTPLSLSSHQVYHPSPSSPNHQAYSNVISGPLTNLGYTPSWHSGAEYGAYQHYQTPDLIPVISEIGYILRQNLYNRIPRMKKLIFILGHRMDRR